MASANSAAGAAAVASELKALLDVAKEVFATIFIGFSVSTMLYGASVLQVYLYFRRYSDRWTLKTMVATLWLVVQPSFTGIETFNFLTLSRLFDTLTTIFAAHSLFLFVWGFLNGKVQPFIAWSFTAEKMLVTIITFIAQCFYARTIMEISGRNKLTTASISFLAITAFGLGIYTTVHLFENPALASISTRSFLIVSGLVQGLAALNDIAITGTLSYYLHIRRTGLPSAEKLLDTLILYALSRGVLTAVAQIMFLVLNVALPHHEYWLPFHMVVGKLYVNSVLATLNVRQSLTQTEVQLGGISILGRNTAMAEQDQIFTKPITFAPIQHIQNPASVTMGTYSEAPEAD
ncbi:hypothetical protein GGX14DRAFT_555047 [Mycena pura]|uniref:DUF6534 domain-containing protein n=1 Tax=Mycena pura TaxID=153505 RepID=A0AAD6YUE2_9AGAR|nr:hypothetical protein GGX14DRAFT_555047 [Mycena pura]